MSPSPSFFRQSCAFPAPRGHADALRSGVRDEGLPYLPRDDFDSSDFWRLGMKALLAFAVLLSLGLTGPALAEKRVALVIGNSAYQNVTALENPANDAVLMAETLKDLGFSVTGDHAQINLDKRGLED